MIARLYQDATLEEAIDAAMTELARHTNHEETTEAITKALNAAEHMPPTPETVETLGGGWVAEEALAIAVYCALTADDFTSGVLRAVNHSGDSDSTGAVTGNLLGVRDGEEALPKDWHVELEDVIRELADDMSTVQTFSSSGFGANEVTPAFWNKYPPY